ncbi:unnamed protein product [Rhizoctonia solani]|nr:unnamed protein product [Rhizoctonia solani]
MQVKVKFLTDEVIPVELEGDSPTVGDLQDALEAMGRPYKNLLRFGKKLEENRDQPLSALNLTEESSIFALDRKEPEPPNVIKIIVKTMGGGSHEVEFADTTQIPDVVNELDRQGALPPVNNQQGRSPLIFKKKALRKGSLKDNGVKDGDELMVIPR